MPLYRSYGALSNDDPSRGKIVTKLDIAVQVEIVNARVMYVAHLYQQDSDSLITDVLRGIVAHADFRRAQKAMTKD